MKMITLRKSYLNIIAMVSIAVVVLNIITYKYLVFEDMNQTDLSKLKGHHIFIDPGHGGVDNGASGHGIVEKVLNLTISQLIKEKLEENGAIVTLTRDNDVDYYTRGKGGKRNDLLARVEMINNSDAEIYISIHANSVRKAMGNVKPGAIVLYGPNFGENKILAEILQKSLKNFPPGNKHPIKQDKSILMLNAPNKPGVLIETGFLNHANEAQLLNTPEYQEKLASAIVYALAYYFSQSEVR